MSGVDAAGALDAEASIAGDMRTAMNDTPAQKNRKSASALRLVPNDPLGWVTVAALAIALGVGVYVLTSPQEAGQPGFILTAGAAVFALVVAFGAVASAYGGRSASASAGSVSCGRDGALSGVAGRILESEPEPLLVTKSDGVVVFANRAYLNFARECGVALTSGVPPRIDRLFVGDGDDAKTLFRLCRAARAVAAADGELGVAMPTGAAAQRCHVAVRPVEGQAGFVLWRIALLPELESAPRADRLAYDALPAAMFEYDATGAIVWANQAGGALAPQAQRLGDLLDEPGDAAQLAEFIQSGAVAGRFYDLKTEDSPHQR